MIGAIVLAVTLAGVPPSDGLTKKEAKKAKEEAKNLAVFVKHIEKFATAKGLTRKFVVVPGIPVRKEINASVTCTLADCRVSITKERLHAFSGIQVEYMAAHEVCHVVSHDADGKLWHMLANEERDQRHRYVDVCVVDLIGSGGLANALFDYGWSEYQIDRYLRKVRWATHQR